ncbi:MAG: hypothetical protein R3A11_06695 [Bdellovibrionota bacterium]
MRGNHSFLVGMVLWSVWAAICPSTQAETHCPKTNLCFYKDSEYTDNIVSNSTSCSSDQQEIEANSLDDVIDYIENIPFDCPKITSIDFHAHGESAYHAILSKTSKPSTGRSWSYLSFWSLLPNDLLIFSEVTKRISTNAKITLGSCDTSDRLKGKRFMIGVAYAFFQNKSGTIQGYESSSFKGPWKVGFGELNFRYDPSRDSFFFYEDDIRQPTEGILYHVDKLEKEINLKYITLTTPLQKQYETYKNISVDKKDFAFETESLIHMNMFHEIKNNAKNDLDLYKNMSSLDNEIASSIFEYYNFDDVIRGFNSIYAEVYEIYRKQLMQHYKND